jgi:O-antigen/teichoic acid export membrane protein
MYTPIIRTMQAIGRMNLYLLSDGIWLCCYVLLLLLFVPKFTIIGIGIAYLLTTTVGIGFSYFYILKYYTTLTIRRSYFFKFFLLSGIIYGISKSVNSLELPLYLGLVGNFLAIILLGYFLVRWFNLLLPTEITKIKTIIRTKI